MIENPEITLKILKAFAQDDVPWPAKFTIEDITNWIDNCDRATIEYHLICAIDSGMLHGDYTKSTTFSGNIYTFGYFDGLTVEGGEYIRNFENSNIWNLAKDKLISEGITITTRNMLSAISVVVNDLIS